MKYQIHSKNFEDSINEIDNVINNELTTLVDNMNSRVKKVDWEGTGYRAYLDSYNNVMQKINDIPFKLSICTTYLKKVLNNYADSQNLIDEMIKEIEEEMEKMKLKKETVDVWDKME